jgi:hypothetical protein
MILDRTFGTTGNKDQPGCASRDRFFDRVLNKRLVHNRQHFLRARFGRRQETGSPPGNREYGGTNSLRQERAPDES